MDLTSQWAWLQQNKQKGEIFVLILIALMIGWQMGRMTSPYYAAHPIVFEDRECSNSSSGGTDKELTDFKEEGLEQRAEADNKESELTATTPVSQVAGAKSDENVSGTGQKKFVGSINSDLFHDLSCPASKRIKEANQIWFASVEEAQKAGYSPSQCTKDKLGI